MQSLKETPQEVAERIRQLAAGVTSPSDAEVIKRYASELEAVAKSEQRNWLFQSPEE